MIKSCVLNNNSFQFENIIMFISLFACKELRDKNTWLPNRLKKKILGLYSAHTFTMTQKAKSALYFSKNRKNISQVLATNGGPVFSWPHPQRLQFPNWIWSSIKTSRAMDNERRNRKKLLLRLECHPGTKRWQAPVTDDWKEKRTCIPDRPMEPQKQPWMSSL